MGYWDRQIGDLEALGIRFSDLEVALLNDNVEGQVLHLSQLYDPASYDGEVIPMTDTDGNPVLVAEVVDVMPGSQHFSDGWSPRERPEQTLADVMGATYGCFEEAFPSYLGVLDTSRWGGMHNFECEIRGEDPRPYPFWMCLPIDEANKDAVDRLVRASDARVRGSAYDAYEFLCGIERESDFCIEPVTLYRWVALHDPISDEEKDRIKEWLSYYADRNYREAALRDAASAYAELIKVGMAPDPAKPDVAFVWQGLNPLPIEQYLQSDDWIALDMWKSIHSRMRHLRARLKPVLGDQVVHRMDSLEML